MTSTLKQPKPFYLIFFIEIWERYGYYGVQALLVLFIVKQLGYDDRTADLLFSVFAALIYLLPAVGGYIGDKVLGTKRTVILGACVLVIGYGLLSLEGVMDYEIALPLAVIALGNGLFKANPASLLAKVYATTELNSDSGFTLYYMAVNIGSLLTMMMTPIVSKYFGWGVAFMTCALALVFATVSFLAFLKILKPYGSPPDFEPLSFRKLGLVLLGCLVVVWGGTELLNHRRMMEFLLGGGILSLFVAYFYHMTRVSSREAKGMVLFLVLFLQGVVFFVLYFQMPTSLNLFALRNVEHVVLGIPWEPASFQVFNAIWVVILSPLLAYLYQYLVKRDRDPVLPFKFALGIVITGLGFLVIPLGSTFAKQGIMGSGWLVLAYFLQSLGELLVSGLGLAMVARYIPARLIGFAMGMWFLSTSIASLIAGEVAAIASIPEHLSFKPLASLEIYQLFFLRVGLVTVGIGILLFFLVPKLRKLEKAYSAVEITTQVR